MQIGIHFVICVAAVVFLVYIFQVQLLRFSLPEKRQRKLVNCFKINKIATVDSPYEIARVAPFDESPLKDRWLFGGLAEHVLVDAFLSLFSSNNLYL